MSATALDDDVKEADLEVRTIAVGRQSLRVAIKHGTKDRPPLLLFNGIGANLELAKPFLRALTDTEAIIFDVPGVGGSPLPALPYRPWMLAAMAARLVVQLGYQRADVAGVSWGGCLAQEFAFRHSKICRRLVLAATSAGAIMIPGKLSAISKLATPRRYIEKGYMRKVAPEIYGGGFRHDPDLIKRHAQGMAGTNRRGYAYQLMAAAGWTSLPWLWSLRQPTLILMGSDDPLVPVSNGRMLARLIPDARLEIIDVGHLFLVTQPVESARIIEGFLAQA